MTAALNCINFERLLVRITQILNLRLTWTARVLALFSASSFSSFSFLRSSLICWNQLKMKPLMQNLLHKLLAVVYIISTLLLLQFNTQSIHDINLDHLHQALCPRDQSFLLVFRISFPLTPALLHPPLIPLFHWEAEIQPTASR